MKTTVLLAGALAVTAALGIAWRYGRAADAARATLATVNQSANHAATEISRLETRLAAVEKERARLRSQIDFLLRPKRADSAPATGRDAAATRAESAHGTSLSSAEAQASLRQIAYFASERSRFAAAYRPLFAELKLSPEQIEQFLAIAGKRLERVNDLNAQPILRRDDPTLEKLRQQAEADEDAAYRDLLGEAAYQRLHEYDRSVMARDFIANVAADAAMWGRPFAAAQLEEMVHILASNSHTFGRGDYFATWKTLAADWAAVDSQLRPLMSDSQWRIYLGRPTARLSYKFEAAVRKAVEADAAAAPQAR